MDTSQRRVGLFGERYTSMASWSYHAWRWLFWPFCGRVTHWSPGTTQVDVCWLKQCRAGGVKTNLVHTSLSSITVVWSGLETAAGPAPRTRDRHHRLWHVCALASFARALYNQCHQYRRPSRPHARSTSYQRAICRPVPAAFYLSQQSCRI